MLIICIYIHKEFTLTPRTEAKYNKIDEEFHLMMQRNQVNGARVVMMMILIYLAMMLVISSVM